MSGLTCCTASALSFSWRAFRRCASCSPIPASYIRPTAPSMRCAAMSAAAACAAQCTCPRQEHIPTEQTPVLQLMASQQSSCAGAPGFAPSQEHCTAWQEHCRAVKLGMATR